jgi:uncharacterized protein (DUF924 family)
MTAAIDADGVIDFWFAEASKARWFKSDPAFDAEVWARLGPLHKAAAAGRLDGWRETPRGCVALAILLDQVPRNAFRGSARAFACDAGARGVARHAIDRDFDRDPGLTNDMRLFLYTPLEHSEARDDQEACVRLIAERIGPGRYLDYAKRHLEAIERFGRFPGRNAALGRATTPEEAAWLADEPGF